MTHLEVEDRASDYLEGLLDAPQRTAVEGHLTGCGACREMLGDFSEVLRLCRVAEDMVPRPWLVSRIMLATVGKPQLRWRERIAAFIGPALQPRVAYPVAMTVFAFSIIVNSAGLSLRNLRFEDLNPRTWIGRANRHGHLIAARAEKFYYDLRVVYEIESRLRQLDRQPTNDEVEAPRPPAPSGGSSRGSRPQRTVATNLGPWAAGSDGNHQALAWAGNRTGYGRTGRSLVP